MWFKKIKEIKFRKLFLFESTKTGLLLLGISLIPICFTIIITQIFLNHEMTLNDFKSSDLYINKYNVKFLIYYVCFGVVHILLSFIAIRQFKDIIKNNISLIHSKQVIRSSNFFWIIMGVTVFFSDYFRINISVLSHAKLYQFLKLNSYFKNYFSSFPKDIIGSDIELFYSFSIFPFILILLGIGVLGWGCFSIGKEISQLEISNGKEEELQYVLKVFFGKLKSNIYLLSIVLVTSTIATIFYFKLPIPIIKNEQVLNSYIDLSVSMGIFWGIMFSITLLFLCIGSYHFLNSSLRKTLSQKKFRKSSEIQDFLSNNMEIYSIVNNVRLILTILSPSIASLVTTTLIKAI